MTKMTIAKYEFIFDEKNSITIQNFTLEYKQIQKIDIAGINRYKTIISLPFYTQSTYTQEPFVDKQRQRALSVLNSALKTKYKTIALRDLNNRQLYTTFKTFTDIHDDQKARKEYSCIYHREPEDMVGEKTAKEVWKKLESVKKITKCSEIKYEDFKLSWKKFVTMLIKNNCAYCGISMQNIHQLAANKKLFTKRGRGYSMEVDQLDPYMHYESDNCEASCYWCNNAKTDEFLPSEFKEIARGINKTWNQRLKKADSSETICFPENSDIWKP